MIFSGSRGNEQRLTSVRELKQLAHELADGARQEDRVVVKWGMPAT